MIEPVRLAPVLSRSKKIRTLKRRAPKCGNCARKGAMYQKLDSEINNAVVFAVDWGNKPFCEECYQKYKAKKKIERDSREEIVIGPGVTKVIISEGDMLTYPQIHEWVKIDYAIRRQGDSRVIDSSAKRGKPLLYQAGCSGPCIHLQVLQANGIHAADFAFGTSDPYCAIFWRDKCVGTTRVRKLTLDPVWATETYVLPLTKRETRWIERAALKGSLKIPRVASAGMPVLRIDMFDYDRMSKNDFLGQVTFSPLQLIRVLGLSDGDAKAFRLAPKKSRGAVGIKVRARSRPRRAVLVAKRHLHPRCASQVYKDKQGHHEFYVVQIANCRDLERADPFSLSDPYCRVYFNEDAIGKTKVVNDCLDPDFENAFFFVEIDANTPPLSRCVLKVEVYDWDQVGEHDLLGEVRVLLCVLVSLSEIV